VAARGSRRWIKWLVGAAAVLVVLVVGGPFVYIHFISGKAPAPFSVRSAASATPSSAASGQSGGAGTTAGTTAGAAKSVAGTWNVARGSQVGYRVKEVLFGQDNIAVGRTSDIAGHLTIRDTTVTAGSFTVQMATIKSDQAERDVQFNGRIMDTSAFPTGKLTLTRPISFAPLPAVGSAKTYTADGNLTLHGSTRPVTFQLTAERTKTGIEASGSIPVLFSKWGIGNPSFGPISTQNHGLLEFLLALRKA
jgi:polyisoprenoid-binding protein YceI